MRRNKYGQIEWQNSCNHRSGFGHRQSSGRYVCKGRRCANRKQADGNRTVELIEQVGGKGIYVKCDVRNKDNIKNLLDRTLETYGDVTTLFNCAGVLVHKPFLEHTDEDFDLINETNFRGYYWTMQTFLPTLIKNGHASITNVASISFYKPESNAYVYGAFKAAVNKMTRDMVREFSPQGVRLNVIAPGPVNTNMTPEYVQNSPKVQQQLIKEVCPAGRLGEPEDIAYAAVWLASDEAAWVTGSTIVVDGGACNMG